MRKKGLKRHFKEDKKGLMKAKLFLIVNFLSSTIFAQIPINGFCRFNEYVTKENYSNLFAVDLNNDGWRDVILVQNPQKSYAVQFWQKNKFNAASERKLSFSLKNIHLHSSFPKGTKKYFFLSRTDRILGIGTFSSNGFFQVNSKVKLKSYASNFDISDIDNDRKNEILIYGSNYEGLSIFNEGKNKLIELMTINEKKLFSYANFIDLDYDGFKDIVAVDFLKNSLLFFYNNRAGNFRETRSININEEIHQFKVADVNSDGFDDIIFVNNNKFTIFKGDSVSSFTKKLIIECPFTPDKYEIFDFNADGFNDIAFINIETGSLFIVYAKNTEYFYEPILYLKRKGIIDFQAFVDRGGRKIIVLDSKGKLYLIDKVLAIDDNLSISIQSKPSTIGSFKYMFSKMNGIYFIDEDDLSLNIFIGTKRNYFEQYYKIPISSPYKNIVVDETQPEIIAFYCYSIGKPEIEIVRVNFETNISTRRILYAKGNIEELKITSDRLKDRQTIFALTKKNNILSIESFDFRDFRYVNSGLNEIAQNAESATLSFNIYKEIYFYTKFNSVTYLNKVVYDNKVNPPVNISTQILSEPKNYFTELKSFSTQYDINKPTAGIINSGKNTLLTLIKSGNFKTIDISNFSPQKNFLQYERLENAENVFLYDNTKNTIKIISLDKNLRAYNIKDFFISDSLKNYVIISLNNKFLIGYTDFSDNLIKFRYIK